MFLINLSKREKTLFYATIAVSCLGLMYNFLLKPAGGKWSELNRLVISKEVELRRNIKYLRQKDDTKRIYQRYAGYAKETTSNEEEMAILLNEVEKQTTTAGIRIVNIRPKPLKNFGFYKKYILEMNCETSMQDCIRFIYNLQKSGQLIRVEKLKLTSQGRDNPLLKARLVITKALTTE